MKNLKKLKTVLNAEEYAIMERAIDTERMNILPKTKEFQHKGFKVNINWNKKVVNINGAEFVFRYFTFCSIDCNDKNDVACLVNWIKYEIENNTFTDSMIALNPALTGRGFFLKTLN